MHPIHHEPSPTRAGMYLLEAWDQTVVPFIAYLRPLVEACDPDAMDVLGRMLYPLSPSMMNVLMHRANQHGDLEARAMLDKLTAHAEEVTVQLLADAALEGFSLSDLS